MKPELIRVFTDESRQTKARYMLQGGLWLRDRDVATFDALCNDVRDRHNMHGHMKWTKVSAAKYDAYRDFVDVFFRMYEQDQIAFRCIVVDTSVLDHDRFNDGDDELGFYKFYYQLLNYWARPTLSYHISIAQRPDRQASRLPTLRAVLNYSLRRVAGGMDVWPVGAIDAPMARDVNAIQVADIILGAVGYHLHDFHLKSGASEPRVELAAHVARQAGLRDLKHKSPPGERAFNIWHIKLQTK